MKIPIHHKIILRLTHRIWNTRIAVILCRAQNRNEISDHALHVLAAKFDRTNGKCEVYTP